MDNMNIEMPRVERCGATGCAYNNDHSCHARAITVGDAEHPACDTSFKASSHTERMDAAGVGACKMLNCKHNSDLECQADVVEVILENDMAQCGTFEAK